MSYFIYSSTSDCLTPPRSWLDDPRPLPKRVPVTVITTDELGLQSITDTWWPESVVNRINTPQRGREETE